MNQLHQSFSVQFTYSVSFTDGLFDAHNTLFADFLASQSTAEHPKKLLFVLDGGILTAFPDLTNQIRAYFAHLPNAQLINDLLTVSGGEGAKNDPALVERIVDAIDRHGIDRHAYVVGIGGGSVLDLVGYAAAISHRGIRHIRIPTTVLAQNDSGVGVKNSVNYRGKKNFLGTFAPPAAVFNDFRFLRMLNDRDWRAGMAEAVKVALIKDPAFFDWLETNGPALSQRDAGAMQYLIHRCADLHLQHIASGDPFEQGSSRPLDFGHWSAHKLEYLTNFELRHGEAVAIGMALDCQYAHLLGLLAETDLNRILNLLQTLGFDLYHPALDSDNGDAVLRGLNEFREHLGGRLTILLLTSIGQGVEVHEMDEALVRQAIGQLASEQKTV
ncbi:MAG: 3-dehydroquinate synthase [Cytophagales bacterium]|nr:MAG: 3-dehydroquinate synthase [Cytophagales bacterium]